MDEADLADGISDIDLVSQYSAASAVSLSRQTTEQRSLFDKILTYPKMYEYYLRQGVDLMTTKADLSKGTKGKPIEICHMCMRNAKDLYMGYENW